MWPQWINMLSLGQWLMLASVPPAIVALYFLKLKRQPLEVPSTYLWRKSIEDLHVNSLWQRMRQSLLLLLQLLLVLLFILAVLRPHWQSMKLADERLVFLIDVSASMSASDVRPTRLEEAKRQIGAMIDAMDSGSSAMLVSFSDTAHVEQGFTDSRRDLRRALELIHPTQRPTALDEALRLAAGLANPPVQLKDEQQTDSLPAKLYIFSDGKFPDVQNFELGNLQPVFVRIGETEVANVGIVAFNTSRNEDKPDQLQAFGRLENCGSKGVSAQVALYIDGNLEDTKQVDVPADGSAAVAFDLEDRETGVLQLKLGEHDPFPLDDEAWTTIARQRRAKVLLVTASNPQLERALGTTRAAELAEVSLAKPDVLTTAAHKKATASGAYDLVIYDGCRPETMPQANTLFLGRLPPDPAWSAGEKVVRPQIIDIDHAHPIMQLVEMGNVDVAEAVSVTGPPGSTRLIESNRGPLFVIGPRDSFEDAVLGFDFYGLNDQQEAVFNTNWPIRLSFPVFVHNLLEYLGGNHDALAAGSRRPGVPVLLHSATTTEKLTIRSPSGATTTVLRGKHNDFNFTATDEVGIYEVQQDDQKTPQKFAVNLFDSAESDVRARKDDTIKIGYTEVHADSGWEPWRRELWKPLLLLGLGVLLLEWYIYNRRVYF